MDSYFITSDWRILVMRIGLAGWIICALILLLYVFLSLIMWSRSRRYSFVAKYELGTLKLTALLFSLSIGHVIFSLLDRQLPKPTELINYFVGFMALSITVMIGYALNRYFKFYYPFVLENRLSHIRFKPRKSPRSGNPMKLLREHEEDAHMTDEMIAQEEAFTFDYDVWLDEVTGYKKIEKYAGHLRTQICSNCKFRTLKNHKEVVMMKPSDKENGRLRKYYKCSYCGHEEIQDADIASRKVEAQMNQGAS